MLNKKSFLVISLIAMFLPLDAIPVSAQNPRTVEISLQKKYDLKSILFSLRHLEWLPRYYRYGILRVDTCEVPFRVWNINRNGVFDLEDGGHGTNLSLDRNNDGKFFGRIEHVSGQEIIEFCGKYFLLDSLSNNGSYARLVETELKIPRVGQKLPEISLTALEANNINIDDSRKKITILDFWASWCKPCVEKFPEMKKRASDFEDEIEVIAINVDYASRTDKAREVIEAYQLDWPHVISGKGNYDPLWKKKKPVCY